MRDPVQAEQAELVLRSEAELAAEREEELKALLAKARKRGEETQARLKYEADEKDAFRKSQEKYYEGYSTRGDSPSDSGSDEPSETPETPADDAEKK